QQELINLQVSLIIRIIENIKISSNIYMSSKSSNYKGVICSKILKVIYSVNFVDNSVIEIVKNKYKDVNFVESSVIDIVKNKYKEYI
ncbi:hypothetical protein CWI37_1815p0010, partial [Hamiltosporidium tvaerminnensis]